MVYVVMLVSIDGLTGNDVKGGSRGPFGDTIPTFTQRE
jgi:hypothetical protein